MMCSEHFRVSDVTTVIGRVLLLVGLSTGIFGSCPNICECETYEYVCGGLNGSVRLRWDNETEVVSSLHLTCLGTNITCSDLPKLNLEVKDVFLYFCSPSILQCMSIAFPETIIEHVHLSNMTEPLASEHIRDLMYTKTLMMHLKDDDTFPFAAINAWNSLTLLVIHGGKLPPCNFNHSSLSRLFILYSNMRNLPAGCFYGLSRLQVLHIAHNKVENIYAGAFRGLNNLVKLSLEGKSLRTIEVGTLSDVQNLKKLSIMDSQLESLPAQLFKGLERLEEVYIFERMYNIIRHRIEIRLNSNIFSQLPSLEKVTLYNLKISAISENIFVDSNNITEITLVKGVISTIPLKIFANLSNLQKLTLSDNNIEALLNGTFSALIALTHLKLDNNKITELPNGIFSTLISLKNLDLSNNNIEHFPKQIFANLTSLAKLSLGNNKIKGLAEGMFGNLKELTALDLRYNMIEQLTAYHLVGLSNLTELLLRDNQIKYLRTIYFADLQPTLRPDDAVIGPQAIGQFIREKLNPFRTPISPFTLMNRLNNLDLSGNNIRRLFSGWQVDMKSVRKLNLSRNHFTVIEDFSVDFSTINIEIDLRDNNISEIVLDPRTSASNSTQLTPTNSSLILNANIICDCNSYGLHLRSKGARLSHEPHYILRGSKCIAPPHLKETLLEDLFPMDLACDLPKHCPDKCTSCIVRGATNEIFVVCSKIPFVLPDYHSKHFPFTYFDEPAIVLHLDYQPQSIQNLNIHTLNLTNTSINKITFQPSLSLKILDVSRNNLDTIPEDFMKTNITLYIANNPLKCDCSFVQELDRYRVGDFNQVYCAGEGNLATLDVRQLCRRTVALIGYICTGIMGGIFLLKITIAVYRYVKKNWIHISRTLFRHGSEYSITLQRLDSAKQFDLFISFAHEDTEFVTNILLPKLEKDFKQKVCIHSRDWIAGDLISDQITQSVEKSRRTIIILTENFILSEWSYLEFRTAHNLSIHEGRPRVILILLNEDIVNDKRLPRDIKSYIAINTYLTWADPNFWEKVKQALPKKGRR